MQTDNEEGEETTEDGEEEREQRDVEEAEEESMRTYVDEQSRILSNIQPPPTPGLWTTTSSDWEQRCGFFVLTTQTQKL